MARCGSVGTKRKNPKRATGSLILQNAKTRAMEKLLVRGVTNPLWPTEIKNSFTLALKIERGMKKRSNHTPRSKIKNISDGKKKRGKLLDEGEGGKKENVVAENKPVLPDKAEKKPGPTRLDL